MEYILQCHEIVKTDFVRAENCFLYDADGRRYVDFESGIWCTALGHNHPRISQVIESQLKQVIHLGTRYPNQIVEDAAKAVLDVVGMEDGKCTFLISGSEAVEFGVQVIRRITGKPLMLTFNNSFLGSYGSAGTKKPEEWFLLDWLACKDVEECLKQIPFDKIGGFAFEPGGSGISFVQFPPAQLIHRIVEEIHKRGGLVLVNEITSGMGRTGKWFGFQHYDIQPDIVAIGKGLGNGYPVSVAAMRRKVADLLEKDGFRYIQSHQNDPLGCAVAKEVISTFREGDWVEKGNALGGFFLNELNQLAAKHSIIKNARGRGMLLGLEFHPHEKITATWMYNALLEKGFLVGYYPAGNLLRFDPSLTMEKENVVSLIESLDEILSGATL
ncbi:MAG: aspartate aminotransferase family protein [Chloroflexi bacterium]|nr:aspartate aminotransferase family protein [Chloroflexota bacterium]